MKKNLKKIVALLLSVLMLMSLMAVGVSAEEGLAEGVNEARGIFDIIIDIFVEIFQFFKFIFYDVFRGELPA